MFEIIPDVPDQLTINECFAVELKSATSHFEFLFLQLSNLNAESQASIQAKKSLLTAYEDFHQSLQSFYALKRQKTAKLEKGVENGNRD